MKRLFIFILVLIMQVIFISCGNKGTNNTVFLEVELLNPINGIEIEQTSTKLEWYINSLQEHNFKVFLGTSTETLNEIGITNEKEFNLSGLENDETYIWKIIVDNNVESKTEEFKVQPINFVKVVLRSPQNGQEINNNNILFDWDNWIAREDLVSKLYIGTNINNLEEYTSSNNSEYTTSSLNENTKYYWKVVTTRIDKEFESEIWSFTTNTLYKSYQEIKDELYDVYVKLETDDLQEINEILNDCLYNIENNPDLSEDNINELLSIYYLDLGWISIRNNNNKQQIDYFISSIDYDNIGLFNGYVGLVFQITNDNLSENIMQYYLYFNNQYEYIDQGFTFKRINGIGYNFSSLVEYLQIIYSITGNDSKLRNSVEYFYSIDNYNMIHEFTFGNYPQQ